MRLQIESRVLGDIARNHVIPTAIRYQNALIKNVQGIKDIFGASYKKTAKEQMKMIEMISKHINAIMESIDAMINERKKANVLDDIEKKAEAYCQKIKPYFEKIRYHSDKLELMIDDELWPLSKYREMLFTR
jgi:glutamine synthetase